MFCCLVLFANNTKQNKHHINVGNEYEKWCVSTTHPYYGIHAQYTPPPMTMKVYKFNKKLLFLKAYSRGCTQKNSNLNMYPQRKKKGVTLIITWMNVEWSGLFFKLDGRVILDLIGSITRQVVALTSNGNSRVHHSASVTSRPMTWSKKIHKRLNAWCRTWATLRDFNIPCLIKIWWFLSTLFGYFI